MRRWTEWIKHWKIVPNVQIEMFNRIQLDFEEREKKLTELEILWFLTLAARNGGDWVSFFGASVFCTLSRVYRDRVGTSLIVMCVDLDHSIELQQQHTICFWLLQKKKQRKRNEKPSNCRHMLVFCSRYLLNRSTVCAVVCPAIKFDFYRLPTDGRVSASTIAGLAWFQRLSFFRKISLLFHL